MYGAKMKWYALVLILMVWLASACEKQNNPSSLLVTVLYHDNAVQQATVQMINDTSGGAGPVTFSQIGSTDASGQVFFNNLNAGKYYVSATGLVPSIGNISGSVHTTVAFSTAATVTISGQ
jgi:hypothetical protein